MKRFRIFMSTDGGMEHDSAHERAVVACARRGEFGLVDVERFKAWVASAEIGEEFATGNGVIVRVKDAAPAPAAGGEG